ncbi:TPA: hypothetical protein N0F65_001002 [Lagenidium giganteum]|uniref:Uncharacterized protein n=1 Tax=Lagenidium giganteum TaxID=4803 RepID=A0AAV2YXR6_9STRA|nr:TPA: hypothetical protein N0F65_001002 [Lagenidium giganteum]
MLWTLDDAENPPSEIAIQEERWRRIRSAQDEETWIVECKRYLSGEVDGLDSAQVERCAKLAPSFEVMLVDCCGISVPVGAWLCMTAPRTRLREWCCPRLCTRRSKATTTPVWTAAIKVCPERTRGSARRSTGLACSECAEVCGQVPRLHHRQASAKAPCTLTR